jgi:exodeoxyribonuclease VII large subunit
VRLELLGWVEQQGARLTRGAGQAVQNRRQRLNDLSRALPKPDTLLETPRQRLDQVSYRLPDALIRGVDRRRLKLSEAAASLRPATLRQLVQGRRDGLKNLSSRLSLRPIEREVARQGDRLTQLAQRMNALQSQRLQQARRGLDATGRQLEILSYKATLDRGYAVVRHGSDVVTRAAGARGADHLRIEFADGEIAVHPDGSDAGVKTVQQSTAQTPAPSKPAARKPKADPGQDDGGQGTLF